MTPEVASLLLRQHEALVNEGTRPARPAKGDLGILLDARDLVSADFGVCWGYENNLVTDAEHANSGCPCYAGRCFRGEVPKCGDCSAFVRDDGRHYCIDERGFGRTAFTPWGDVKDGPG